MAMPVSPSKRPPPAFHSNELDRPIAELLVSHVPLLTGLSPDSHEVKSFVNHGQLVKLQDGCYYMVEGQTKLGQMTVLLQGKIHLLKDDKMRECLKAPATFGLSALFGEPKAVEYSFMPDGQCKLFTLTQASFKAYLQQHPNMAPKMLANILHELEPSTAAHLKPGSRDFKTRSSSTRQPPKDAKSTKVVFYDAKPYEVEYLKKCNEKARYDVVYLEETLSKETAHLAKGAHVVGIFVHDFLTRDILDAWQGPEYPLVTLRCAGFDFVDVQACDERQVSVVRVPSYSPTAIAEFAVALMLSLNRRLLQAHQRIRQGDFSLDGLVGFNMRGKTVGVIGTGKIGFFTTQILQGFGCRVICYDIFHNPVLLQQGVPYVSLDELLESSDIITLHCPLLKDTFHMIDAHALNKMKDGVMFINTSRGGLVDTEALVEAIKSGKVATCGLDVVEREGEYFYRDLSNKVIRDDALARLIGFNNVILTSHQAYLTKEALQEIANTTFSNIHEYLIRGKRMRALTNSVNSVESLASPQA